MKTILVLLLTALPLCTDTGGEIAVAARKQIGVTLSYDPAYTTLKYPGGDVAADLGVCTDVVIRALRVGLGKDLQKLVHDDMAAHFSSYPKNWGLKRPDRNIDHRRVPNLQKYFQRQGWKLPTGKVAADFLPGDIVTCIVPPHLPHVMIVSDRESVIGVPLVIHNIGAGALEEDKLFAFELTGHYRVKIP